MEATAIQSVEKKHHNGSIGKCATEQLQPTQEF